MPSVQPRHCLLRQLQQTEQTYFFTQCQTCSQGHNKWGQGLGLRGQGQGLNLRHQELDIWSHGQQKLYLRPTLLTDACTVYIYICRTACRHKQCAVTKYSLDRCRAQGHDHRDQVRELDFWGIGQEKKPVASRTTKCINKHIQGAFSCSSFGTSVGHSSNSLFVQSP